MTTTPIVHGGQRIVWIDAAKGACIFMVVLWHTTIFSYTRIDFGTLPLDSLWTGVLTAFKPLRMPLFFLISGFLAHSAITRRTWQATFRSRVATLFWLYVLWMTINWLVISLMRTQIPGAAGVIPGEAYTLDVVEFMRGVFLADSGIWYLYALVLYFVVCKIFNRVTVPLLVTLALLQILSEHITQAWNFQKLLDYGIFYALGCFGRDHIARIYADFSARRWALVGVVLLASMALARQLGIFYWPVMQLFLSCLMVSFAIDTLSLILRFWQMRALQALGKRTLPVYVLHMLLVHPVTLLLADVDLSGTAGQALAVALPVLIATAVCAGCLLVRLVLDRGPGRALFDFPAMRNRPVAQGT
ncbi:acyltransferase family protein [Kushneria sp. TE3]|uniref:acyltransferase family protein n=1 Tax=Kushneria sp. TE3 TaxID=3449832 RepID=UPI003F68863E